MSHNWTVFDNWMTRIAGITTILAFLVPLLVAGANWVANHVDAQGSTDASSGKMIYVYLVVNESACGGNDSPRAIKGTVTPTGWESDWDEGDAVVYPRVAEGVKNVATLQVKCDREIDGTWTVSQIITVNQEFTPRSHNETIRVG